MDRHEVVLFALAGILSVALMAGVNFALASNFRWILVVPVLTWSIGIALAAFGSIAVPVKAGEHPHAQ